VHLWPVQILQVPVPFPPLRYYQLWHERTHASAAARWLREQIRSVAAALKPDDAKPRQSRANTPPPQESTQ
jgi:DNA-binding transcriptional LysR family regulator